MYRVENSKVRRCWECRRNDNWKMMENRYADERPARWMRPDASWFADWNFHKGSGGQWRKFLRLNCAATRDGLPESQALIKCKRTYQSSGDRRNANCKQLQRLAEFAQSWGKMITGIAALEAFAVNKHLEIG